MTRSWSRSPATAACTWATPRSKKEEITGQIKDQIANKLDKTVYVKSDARAKYGDVVAVVDEIRSAGVDQLGLLTEKVQAGSTPKPPTPDAPANPGD